MASRMDKYRDLDDNVVGKRQSKNENLYRSIYENNYYTNIESVTTLEKTNEIDLAQIQELLKEREKNKKREILKNIDNKIKVEEQVEEELKNYDIRDILNKAKNEKPQDEKTRNLSNTSYDILKNLNLKGPEKHDTLDNTAVIRNKNDEELSLDMLSDLKGNTLVKNEDNINGLLEEVKEAKEKYQPKNDSQDELDKSFYTSSLGFKEDDFEQLKDIQDSIKTNNKMIKILFTILFTVVLLTIAFIVYKLI